MRPWTSIFGLGAILAATGPAMAELLYFKGGGAVQLPCHRVGSRVVVEAPGGPVAFEASDFRLILPGGDPASEWPSRLVEARRVGVDARLAAAWWALENGLTPEAASTLRAVHASDPALEPAATLVRSLDLVEPPLPDPDIVDLKAALGGSFREARSPHFLLLHQGTEAGARARLDVLERVYTTYFLVFAGRGLDLPPPRRRLASAVFASRDAYIAFLKREDGGAFATTQGFFHPTRGAVVAYEPPPGASGRDDARRALLADLDRRAILLGIAAHETVHQLVADTGLAPRHDAFPTWLHEGLAAQFEVVRGGHWSGVGRAHDLRLPAWRSIRPAPRLAPVVRDEGFGRGYREDLYAEAWSLVYFLRKRHPKEFARYLDLLRVPIAGPPPPGRPLDLFRASFGPDLAALEEEWRGFLRSATTPLEDGPGTDRANRP